MTRHEREQKIEASIEELQRLLRHSTPRPWKWEETSDGWDGETVKLSGTVNGRPSGILAGWGHDAWGIQFYEPDPLDKKYPYRGTDKPETAAAIYGEIPNADLIVWLANNGEAIAKILEHASLLATFADVVLRLIQEERGPLNSDLLGGDQIGFHGSILANEKRKLTKWLLALKTPSLESTKHSR